MARSTAMTTQTEIESTTVTVEIYHGEIGADATADVRCFGLDELTQDVFDEHYESLGEPVEIDSGVLDAGEPVLAIEILEDVWRRTQGGRNDDELPYDGSQVRSSCVGDVVVLDGVPFAAADVGFERVELDVDQDDEDDGIEIVTDGGQDVVESLDELDEDAVYRYENAEAGSDRHTFTVNLDWIDADDFADYGEGSVGLNYRDGYVADVPVSNVESMIEDGRIVLVEPAGDDPELVTDGGVDLPAAQDVDLWDVEEGDEIHLPGGTVLEIVEAIHHSRDFGDDSHRFRARKPSGHVVRLESHNLETAFASGGELIKPPTQNPDAIPVDDFYYGDSPRWLAVRHRIEYVRRNQYGRDFVTGEKIGQSVVAVDPDDAAV